MTRKSRREIEREVRDLSDRRGDDEEWFTVACEHDDGTLTDPDGDPLPEDADPVLIIPWHVARTWS
jgi:hypothetical protein